jgi:hypothetical protein
MLPKITIRRSKTPLTKNPVSEAVRRENREWAKGIVFSDAIRHYVRIAELSHAIAAAKLPEAEVIIRPLCLNFWLQGYKEVGYNLMVEMRNA